MSFCLGAPIKFPNQIIEGLGQNMDLITFRDLQKLLFGFFVEKVAQMVGKYFQVSRQTARQQDDDQTSRDNSPCRSPCSLASTASRVK